MLKKIIISRKSLIGLPIFIFLATSVLGQSKEIGIGVVGSFYTGDLSRNLELGEIRPGIMLNYRINYNDYFTLRYNLTINSLHGSDDEPVDAFAAQRNQSFTATQFEAAGLVEYHFLDYRDNPAYRNFSPYLYAGIGIMAFDGSGSIESDFSKVQPVIPLGGGIKYLLNWKWTLAAEFGARKTFFDYLDNVSDGDLRQKNYQYGNEFVNDWYYYLGVSVSYTFHIVPCPYGSGN